MKTIFKIYRNVLLIVFIMLFTVTVVPSLFGVDASIVLSSSMEPNIPVGALSYIDSKTGVEEIHVGDVIAFKTGNKKVIHRVIRLNDETKTIITQGDNNDHPDTPIKYDSYCGKVVYHISKAGFVLKWIQSPIGMMIMAYLALVSVVSSIIYRDDEIKPANIVITEADVSKRKASVDASIQSIIRKAMNCVKNPSKDA